MSELLIRVVAAVIARGEELLTCRRPQHKRYGGLWEFPGGKCQPGESLAAAARRELHEELSIEVVEVGQPDFIIRDPGSRYLLIFAPVSVTGEPQCSEHIELRWAKPEDLANMSLAPGDKWYLDFIFRRTQHLRGDLACPRVGNRSLS